jgi:hypothetical protein
MTGDGIVNRQDNGEADSGSDNDDVLKLADHLESNRPAPGAALRGEVRAFLAAAEASGLLVARPLRLWLRVAACAGTGAILLALVAAGVGGWGPFGG